MFTVTSKHIPLCVGCDLDTYECVRMEKLIIAQLISACSETLKLANFQLLLQNIEWRSI